MSGRAASEVTSAFCLNVLATFFFYWGLVVLVWENAVAVDVQFTCQVLANEVVIEEEKKNGKVFVAISNNTTFPL